MSAKKRFGITIITIFIIIILTVFAVENFLDWDAILRPKIVLYTNQNFSTYQVDFNKIKVSLWRQKLHIYNVNISETNDIKNINNKKVEYSTIENFSLDFNILKLLQKKLSISDVNIENAHLSINLQDVLHNHSMMHNINYRLINAKLHFNNYLNRFVLIKKGSFSFKKSINGDLALQIGSEIYNAKLKTKNQDLLINFENAKNNLSVKANYTINDKGSINIKNGKFEGKGLNLFNVLQNIFINKASPDVPLIIFNDNKFQINGNFSVSDNLIDITDIVFDSDFLSLTANVKRSKKSNLEPSVALKISKLDFDNLLAKQNYFLIKDLLISKILYNSYLKNSKFSIEAKNLLFNKVNFELYSDFGVHDNAFYMKNLKVLFDKSMVNVQGRSSISESEQKFSGNMEIDCKNFNNFLKLINLSYKEHVDLNQECHLVADFELSFMNFIMSNVILNFANEVFTTNSLECRLYDNISFIFSNIKGSNLNFENKNLNNYIENYLYPILNYFESEINNLNFNFYFEQFKLNNLVIKNISFDTLVSHKMINLNNIHFTIAKENFGGYIYLYNRNRRTFVNANLKVANLWLDIENLLLKELNSDFLKNLDCHLLLNIKKIYSNNLVVEDVMLNFAANDNIAHCSDCKFSINDGLFVTNSFFDFRNFIFKSKFSVKNFNLAMQNFDFLPVNHGILFANGYFESFGNNLIKMFQTLDGKIKIAGQNFLINGFNIDNMVNNINRVKNETQLEKLIDRSLYRGQTTFNNVSGNIFIKNRLVDADLRFVTGLTGGAFLGKIDLSKNQLEAMTRFIFFIKSLNNNNLKEKFAIDIKLKGITSSPERYIDKDQLKDYVLFGINPFKK